MDGWYNEGLNVDLKRRLHEEFGPKGIIAWSGCCRLGCTGSYDEYDDAFSMRKAPGIVFFPLHLEGGNYAAERSDVWVNYLDLSYVRTHWDEEKAFIDRWCEIVGLGANEYKVTLPEDQNRAIEVRFTRPVMLDPMPDEDDEDEENVGDAN